MLRAPLLTCSLQLWRQATGTRASSTHDEKHSATVTHQYPVHCISAGFWNVYVAHCGNGDALAPIHRREVWDLSASRAVNALQNTLWL